MFSITLFCSALGVGLYALDSLCSLYNLFNVFNPNTLNNFHYSYRFESIPLYYYNPKYTLNVYSLEYFCNLTYIQNTIYPYGIGTPENRYDLFLIDSINNWDYHLGPDLPKYYGNNWDELIANIYNSDSSDSSVSSKTSHSPESRYSGEKNTFDPNSPQSIYGTRSTVAQRSSHYLLIIDEFE